MNFIVVCLFVFIVGLLVVKILIDVDKSKGFDWNLELFEKRSLGFFNIWNFFIVKRIVGKYDLGLYFILLVKWKLGCVFLELWNKSFINMIYGVIRFW